MTRAYCVSKASLRVANEPEPVERAGPRAEGPEGLAAAGGVRLAGRVLLAGEGDADRNAVSAQRALQPGRVGGFAEGDLDVAVGLPVTVQAARWTPRTTGRRVPAARAAGGRVAGGQGHAHGHGRRSCRTHGCGYAGDAVPGAHRARPRFTICAAGVVEWTSVKDSRTAVIRSSSFMMSSPGAWWA